MKSQKLSNKSKQFIDLYINDNIKEETAIAERLVLKIFLFLVPVFLLVAVGYFLFYLILKNNFQFFYLILIAYLVCVIVYHRIIYYIIKKGKKNIIFGFINVGIEISTVSIVILLLYKTLNAEIILTGPLVMVYILMIIMSGFRYSLRLSLFAGIMGAFQHVLIYVFLIREVSPDLMSRIMDLGFSGIFQKSLYILMAGVISGFLAINTKRLINKIALKSLEAQQVKTTFGQYVSTQIRDSILSGKIDLGGEEKDGVILFSDIRNFTSLLEKNRPKEIINQLNEYFSAMVEVIAKNNGVVNKFIGDAIMSVFGLFGDHTQIEENAVNAAIQMYAKLAELNKKWESEGKTTLQMGIGIAGGSFLTGNIGSEDRKEFTCIGDVVNVASRLETLTKYYSVGIIISEELKKNLVGNFLLRQLDIVQVKGKEKPIKIYEVFESEAGEIIEKKKGIQLKYNEAYDLYLKGEFEKAAIIYNELIKSVGLHHYLKDKCADPVLELYKKRCIYLLKKKKAGLIKNWNGIYELKQK